MVEGVERFWGMVMFSGPAKQPEKVERLEYNPNQLAALAGAKPPQEN